MGIPDRKSREPLICCREFQKGMRRGPVERLGSRLAFVVLNRRNKWLGESGRGGLANGCFAKSGRRSHVHFLRKWEIELSISPHMLGLFASVTGGRCD